MSQSVWTSLLCSVPLAEDRGFILHTPPSNFTSSIRISDNTVMTTSRDVLETLGTDKQPSDVMVALGYSSGIKANWNKKFSTTPG